MTTMENHTETPPPPALPAPRTPGEHEGSVAGLCCADVHADLIDAALDIKDAWMVGGDMWRDMVRQQPLHPSMQRLLDSGATVEHRHHRGNGVGPLAAPDTDPLAVGAGESGGAPHQPARADQ